MGIEGIPPDGEQIAANNHEITPAQQISNDFLKDVEIPKRAMKFLDEKLLPIRNEELQEGFKAVQEIAKKAREKHSPENPCAKVQKPKPPPKNFIDWLLGD